MGAERGPKLGFSTWMMAFIVLSRHELHISTKVGHILGELCGAVLEVVTHGGQLLIDMHPKMVASIVIV
jgi:hypothetical protein